MKNSLKGFKFIKSNDDMLIRDVKEYFEDPNIYLKQINRIIIGKERLKTYQNEINNNEENKKEINKEIANNNKTKNYRAKRFSTQKNTLKSNFYSLTEGNERKPLNIGIHYLLETTNEILNKYEEGKKREEQEKLKGTDNLIPKNVIERVKNKYIDQEKTIKRMVIENNNDNIITDILARKCKNKKENLLCNTIENYRIKNQLKDYIENNKNLYEKFGNYCWYMNLRRPNSINKSKGNFINIGKVEKNIWEPMVDYPDKSVEIVKKVEKPFNSKTNFENFFKEKYIRPNIKINKKIKINKIPELRDINNMIIKGKNIISLEKEIFLKYVNKGNKYRVYKDPRENNKRYCKNYVFKSDYKYLPTKIKL